ncbi:MAG TPA: DUF4143 domain-containing protein [Kiritimatiellia bacterium]|nr:DUF4143 domain-containing protein [Kiritimatiellia bacterium]
MYPRLLKPPDSSFFLFGPRGTGKSTWIRANFSGAPSYDLLNSSEVIRLSRDPSLLYRECSTLPPNSWVVIDEVQKVPMILEEVHRLIENRNLRFVLSGSSARKLRRGGANLLAGRALVKNMYPLAHAELPDGVNINKCIEFGLLPMAVTTQDPKPFLFAYAQTYLQEEIRAEALTRNIGNFSRFLEVAARQNGQVTNVSNISREAAVTRQTVQNYFDILIDTLIGRWLPAWKLKTSTKQVQHPKFYFFDTGVTRALSGRLPYPPTEEERGALFETFVIHQILSHLDYSGLHYPIYFWRSYDGIEVDVVCETRNGFFALEIKSSARWEKKYGRGLKRFQNELGKNKVAAYGVYLGKNPSIWDDIQVLPIKDFLSRLSSGELIQ